MVCEIELKPVGVDASTHGLSELLPPDVYVTSLHHLVCTQPIEMCKGNFSDELIQSLFRFEATGLYVFEMIE